MQEQDYTGTMGTSQQTGGNGGIVLFLIGLFTGAAVAAPVATLIAKKVGDNRRKSEVQKAYLEGERQGAQIVKEQARREVLENASKTPSKAPRSSSGISDDQDIEKEAREAPDGISEALRGNDPFFNGIPEEKLMDLVNRDLADEGMSQEGIIRLNAAYLKCKDSGSWASKDDPEGFQASSYRMMLMAKANHIRTQIVKKIAEEKMDIHGEVPKDLDDIVADEKDKKSADEIEKEQGSVISDSDNPEVVMEQPDGSFTYFSPSQNPYLNGQIEDPEARKKFEQHMAECESPSDDDINDYDLTIDDEEATQEAREFSESHAQYLEMVNKYKNMHGDIPPMTISREMFDNEHYLEKSFVNWYEKDDIFEENDKRIEDPYYNFGFVTGREMFAPGRTANREDPDICYVRNLKLSTDFEITRIHGSYAQLIEDGEAYYRGDTDTQ